MRDELLGYYERELVFLRRMGAEFARKYPKLAARLQLDEEKVEDPHVERMIEAFAFLTGRIALKLDDELPEITESFLNVLYPHYLAPIPSMAIVQFAFGSPNDARGKYADSYIRLSMRCYGDSNLHELKVGTTGEPLKSLRFYLDGDPQ